MGAFLQRDDKHRTVFGISVSVYEVVPTPKPFFFLFRYVDTDTVLRYVWYGMIPVSITDSR